MITPLRETQLLPGTLENLFYPPAEYKYFERAKDIPFATSSALAKAAWAADASMLAYARYGPRRMTDQELDEQFRTAGLEYRKIGGTAANWNAPGTQAVFASCEQFAILAFRGTERDDPDDALADSDLVLVPESDHRPAAADSTSALAHLAFVAHLFSEPCLVHRGFQRALDEVWESVHNSVSSYRAIHPAAEICFTGHSLGGALALLAYSRFADPNLSMFSFGCPRVGDRPFRDRVLSNPGRGIYRYVNFNDVVAHVPLDNLFYKHAPEWCYRIDTNGSIRPDDGMFNGDVNALRTAVLSLPASVRLGTLSTIEAPAGLVDHSPARYCLRLWACV